jgi:hypothetical protein
MKQVIVQAYCDLAHTEDTSASQEVTFEGQLLDVCDEHAESVREQIEAIRDLFMAGVAVDAKPVTRRRTGRPSSGMKESLTWRTCPECGHVSPTRSATGQHVKSNHGKRLGDFDWPTT